MTLRTEVEKMIHAGMTCEEIVQHYRIIGGPNFRPHKYRDAYAQIVGPEVMERIRNGERLKAEEDAKASALPQVVDGIEKIYKEVMVGIQTDLRDKNNGGGIKKMLISLPRVRWLEREDVD